MDAFDHKVTEILTRVQSSSLSDTQKADIYASIHNGLRTLVWPILVSHIPESELKDAVDHPETMTVTRYGELMEKAVSDPASAREIHEEVMGALGEIEDLLTKQSIPA
ncbi:MAG: hypothetical protein AAB557_03520 [Patescibacteria group bacterium]